MNKPNVEISPCEKDPTRLQLMFSADLQLRFVYTIEKSVDYRSFVTAWLERGEAPVNAIHISS